MGNRSVSSRRSVVASLAVAVGLVAPLLATASAGAAPSCSTPSKPMSFAPTTIIDENRAGGEPSIQSLADGSLLYASHAGTTHFYTPAGTQPKTSAFFSNYEGQTYVWRSTDDGQTWNFVRRTVPANVPASGFSDPDFAVDSAGNVYYSEINLVNIAVSSSSDSGKSFTLQNFFGEVLTDRQWSEADEEGVLYITGNHQGTGGTFPTKPVGNAGHMLYKSTDGGKTFILGQAIRGGLGDIKIDKRDGTVYEANLQGETLQMSILRDARAGDLRPLQPLIASGVRMLGHWPAIDIDDDGNLYITWDESGRGSRPAGIYYSYSIDRGMTWAEPLRVDADARTDTWPWIAVGDPGRVGIAWLQADEPLPNHNAQTAGSHGWRIAAAQTLTGLGCDGRRPGFTSTIMTAEPVHRGTICQGGTACQAQAIDRRLGDYFTVDVDTHGMLVAAYSDTSRGGAVSLPGFSRQNGGPSFLASGDDDAGPRVLGRRQGRVLPRTGLGDGWVALLATIMVLGALATRRWSARGV